MVWLCSWQTMAFNCTHAHIVTYILSTVSSRGKGIGQPQQEAAEEHVAMSHSAWWQNMSATVRMEAQQVCSYVLRVNKCQRSMTAVTWRGCGYWRQSGGTSGWLGAEPVC